MPLLLGAPWTPALVAPLIAAAASWSWWSTIRRHRALGRKAIQARLTELGETPVSIERLPDWAVPERAGLAGAVTVFAVVSHRDDGLEVRREWAYEPALVGRQSRSLKHRAGGGVWIPLA